MWYTVYNAAVQLALGGYALGQYVERDGVIWKSNVASNLRAPNAPGVYWSLYA